MTDLGKASQRRGFELLEQQPVADDMFDVVRHHRQHRPGKKESEISVVKRRECRLPWRVRLDHRTGRAGHIAPHYSCSRVRIIPIFAVPVLIQ